ncbi:MAG: hypothetical protein CMJ84_01935, partial [Planctomycetes bacterium]|nr:hypothetical protein [Planctomycetota bacterium]
MDIAVGRHEGCADTRELGGQFRVLHGDALARRDGVNGTARRARRDGVNGTARRARRDGVSSTARRARRDGVS